MKKIALIGGGGHAKVIVDLINELNIYKIVGFYDDNISKKLYDIPNLGKINEIDRSIENFIISVGNNKIREKIYKKNKDLNWTTLIHPSAVVSKTSKIEEGVVVCAGSIIQVDVTIGKHSIINTGCSIDHECVIEKFCSISPNATLCGQVKIGNFTFIGANSTIIQNITIGSKCIIGAGSVIIKNVENNCKVVGNPSRII